MNNSLVNIFRIPEPKKSFICAWMLFVFRLGTHIPTPGIDTHVMNSLSVRSQAGFWISTCFAA